MIKQPAIALLREAAEILRDPGGRSPADVDEVAARLEVIAASAAEWGIAGMLEREGNGNLHPESVRTADKSRRLIALPEAELHDFLTTMRVLAQWLREAGFDAEPPLQPDSLTSIDERR
jgi:hypothetical protein